LTVGVAMISFGLICAVGGAYFRRRRPPSKTLVFRIVAYDRLILFETVGGVGFILLGVGAIASSIGATIVRTASEVLAILVLITATALLIWGPRRVNRT